MWRIRPCKYSDLKSLLAMSKRVGEGMTSMPQHSLGWRRKIAAAEASFAGSSDAGNYFLVLEDVATGEIIGTTAVYTGVGETRPFYALRHDKAKHSLFLEQAMTGASEIGSLFLSPDARVKGLGRALSQSRFLMMATFPQLFSAPVIASCRGWLDNNDDSPVWRAIGQYYADVDFATVIERSTEKGNIWLASSLPKHVPLRHVSPEVFCLLGTPHIDSAPAHDILSKENFVQSDFIDLADGGPILTCQPKRIASYQASCTAKLERAKGSLKSDQMYMVACGALKDFEIIICRGEMLDNNTLLVDDTAQPLLNKYLNKRVKVLQIQSSEEMLNKAKQLNNRAA